jgi:hypothetical protein
LMSVLMKPTNIQQIPAGRYSPVSKNKIPSPAVDSLF